MILEATTLFFFFFSLNSYGGISSRSINYILDLFFFKYSLSKVDPLRLVFKGTELLSLTLVVVIVVSHLDDLKEVKNCNNGANIYIGSHNLINSLIKIYINLKTKELIFLEEY